MNKRVSLVLLAAVSLLVALSTLTQAADENRAAVVVSFGGGVVATRCVSFSEPEISGYDLLQRSGLSLLVEEQGAGALVCSIEGTGCPADDCLCACRGGGNCVYWSYWMGANGSWTYSAAGSSIRRLGDGAIDGWAWGPGSVTEATPPPALSFDDVCTTGATASLTPSVTPTPLIIVTPAPPTETPSTTTPTARPSASATAGATTPATPGTPATPETPATAATAATSATPAAAATPAATPLDPATPQPGSGVPAQPLAATQPPSPPQPTAVSSGGGEGYPSAIEGNASAAGATTAPPVIMAQVATPAAGLLPTEGAPPEASPAAVAQVTVIGAGVVPEAPPASVETADEAPMSAILWLSYGALAAMLLALSGLVLLARRRGSAG